MLSSIWFLGFVLPLLYRIKPVRGMSEIGLLSRSLYRSCYKILATKFIWRNLPAIRALTRAKKWMNATNVINILDITHRNVNYFTICQLIPHSDTLTTT